MEFNQQLDCSWTVPGKLPQILRPPLLLCHDTPESCPVVGTGNVLAELGKPDEALAACRESLRIDPNYGDAGSNLAELLDMAGRRVEAKAEWRAYLGQDSTSQWARFPESQLG